MNMMASIGYEMVAVICGLILPRLILSTFGSSYNGITSSITQFLSCVTLLRAGIGGVTRASLYKPLADNDMESVSAIINATSKFMQRVALIFAGMIIVFACIYPFLTNDEFEWFFSFTLVLILGVSTFVQYYFGITYQMLLQADQKQYVISIIQIITTVMNTAVAAALIRVGGSIHTVKLGSAIVFSLNPIAINRYVKKAYCLNKKVSPNNQAIRQRWDAFWQSVAFFVHNNTDIIVLTCFANIKEVSVYTVYNYVIANIRNIIVTFVTGFGAAFGDMLAKKEEGLIRKNLQVYELVIFDLTAIIYTTAGIMIVPFALIYTSGVTDVNYARPVFAIFITIAGAFSCFRIPYQTIVEAAGHFKQTKNGAFVEAGLNIVISIAAVIKFGLVGVAMGTVVATIFRSIQYSTYLSKHIVKRSISVFWKHIMVNGTIAIIVAIISIRLFTFEITNFWLWAIKSVLVALSSALFVVISSLVFYREDFLYLFGKMKKMAMHKMNM